MASTYNPKKVLITWGEVLVQGIADGNFVTAARNNPSVTLAVGSDGEACRAISNDKSGTVTITLLQSSITNAQFAAAAALDEATGDGVKPLFVKDLSGLDVVKCDSAWIQKPADAEYSRETSNRVWVLESDNMDVLVGGIP